MRKCWAWHKLYLWRDSVILNPWIRITWVLKSSHGCLMSVSWIIISQHGTLPLCLYSSTSDSHLDPDHKSQVSKFLPKVESAVKIGPTRKNSDLGISHDHRLFKSKKKLRGLRMELWQARNSPCRSGCPQTHRKLPSSILLSAGVKVLAVLRYQNVLSPFSCQPVPDTVLYSNSLSWNCIYLTAILDQLKPCFLCNISLSRQALSRSQIPNLCAPSTILNFVVFFHYRRFFSKSCIWGEVVKWPQMSSE